MASFVYYIEGEKREFIISDDVYSSVLQTWNSFKEDIVHQNRYFSGEEIIRILSKLNFMPVLPPHTHLTLYRARIGDFEHTPNSEMMAPPADKTSDGRCNPAGISYLYLSSSKDTAIREIRPQIGDKVTLATFDVDVSNIFTFNVYLMEHYGIKAENEYAKCLLFLILEDLSSAVTKNNHLDYIPLQYISEFIKSRGYDGFLYSSVYQTGTNLVMFHWENLVTLRAKETVLIKNTCIEYE